MVEFIVAEDEVEGESGEKFEHGGGDQVAGVEISGGAMGGEDVERAAGGGGVIVGVGKDGQEHKNSAFRSPRYMDGARVLIPRDQHVSARAACLLW